MERHPELTSDSIARDVAALLRMELHPRIKRGAINFALWKWSELDGKFEGCKLWSPEARQEWEEWNPGQGSANPVTHEHIVPRTVIIDLLIGQGQGAEPPTFDSVKSFLADICRAAVITNFQNDQLNKCGLKSSMPSDWDQKDPFARYRHEKVQIHLDLLENGVCNRVC